jgi:ribonuclease D
MLRRHRVLNLTGTTYPLQVGSATMAVPDPARLAARAREEGRLGIDTEFMPEGRYRPLLCLVQIVVGTEIAILDPLAGEPWDPQPLAEVLADPAIEIVLHAGRQDVALLRRMWKTDIINVFDTQVAAGFAGFSAQAGYLGLLHDVLRIRLAKSASFTRWDHRPLTEEQLKYAGEDVEHLLPLADDLQARLTERGRLEWAREECLPIAAATDERDPDEVWRRLPRSSGMDPRERAVARELAAWRERTAEREDRPVGAILRDPSVVELAKRQPSDRGALGAIRGLTPDVMRRRGKEIVEAIARGKQGEPIRLAAEERLSTESGDGPVIALAESLVRARALEAGLAYELIAARADLSPVVVSVRRGLEPPDVRTLQGWRRELVGDELLSLLRGERTLQVAAGRVAVSGT